MFLLFGLPESGIDEIARVMHVAGAGLTADAVGGPGHFAVSSALDGLAAEINAEVGIAPDLPGPLILPQTSLAETRRKIDRRLAPSLPRARGAIAAALPEPRAQPIVIAAASMGSLPGFWLRAFEGAGVAVRPVLHRNPLAVAQLARKARRVPRQTIFLWHHLALDVLSAAPAGVEVLASPAGDLTALGLSQGAQGGGPERHPRDDADLSGVAIVSDQTRDLDRLLRAWPALDPDARASAVADLRTRFDEAVTLTGAARLVTPNAAPAEAAPETPAATPAIAGGLRPPPPPLLFHYHIFKNAGTSVDKMLAANFGAAWAEREFGSGTLPERHQAIRAFLEEYAHLRAFSSHTAPLPVPSLADRMVFPIIFVRHPLLRVRSAYEFEKGQDATTRGAVLAKTTDLQGYVTTLLDDPKARHLRNFQTARFAAGTPGPFAQERQRALETASRLPYVGLVEAYDRSVERLGELVRPMFPDFRVIALHENATSPKTETSPEDRLAALRDELGAALYDRLLAENAHDLDLFEQVRATYPPN